MRIKAPLPTHAIDTRRPARFSAGGAALVSVWLQNYAARRELRQCASLGKTEPQRIFELLGRKREVARERLAVRDGYVDALDAYRRKEWEKALAGFEDCLAIIPCDVPSKLFLERIAQFRVTAPGAEWNGVWSLVE